MLLGFRAAPVGLRLSRQQRFPPAPSAAAETDGDAILPRDEVLAEHRQLA
jgi:hypothetical protein